MPTDPNQHGGEIGIVGTIGAFSAAIVGAASAWAVSHGANRTQRGIKNVDANVTNTNNLIVGLQSTVRDYEIENRALRGEMVEIRAAATRMGEMMTTIQERFNVLQTEHSRMQEDHSRELSAMRNAHSREMETMRRGHSDEMDALRRHIDFSSGLTQAVAAVPTLMLHDELKDVKAQVDLNTTALKDADLTKGTES